MAHRRGLSARLAVILFVLLGMLLGACSNSATRPVASPSGVAEGAVGEGDLTLTLDGVRVLIPAAAAPKGTLVTVRSENDATFGAGVVPVSPAVDVRLEGGLQPTAPISITFPVDPEALPGGAAESLVGYSLHQGEPVLAAGVYSEKSKAFTFEAERLSFFQAISLDLRSLVAEAETAIMQGLGLEMAEPGCTADKVEIDGWAYAAVSPSQAWLCVSTAQNGPRATAYPNSAIPLMVTSDAASTLETQPTSVKLSSSVLLAIVRAIGLVDSSSQAAVMPGTTAVLTFDGTPSEVQIRFQQHAGLLVMAIVAAVADLALEKLGVSFRLVRVLGELECLSEVAKAAPLGARMSGELVGAITRAFFGCALSFGADMLSIAGRVALGVIAAAATVLVAPIVAVLNKAAGSGQETVQLDITPPVQLKGDCGSVDFGINLGGLTGPAADKAVAVYEAAVACDRDALLQIISEDGTEVTLGAMSAEELFAIPSPENRYWVTTRLMSLQPAVHSDGLFWPWRDESTGEPDWAELVASGLITPDEVNYLWDDGSYYGWAISIPYDGRLNWFGQGE